MHDAPEDDEEESEDALQNAVAVAKAQTPRNILRRRLLEARIACSVADVRLQQLQHIYIYAAQVAASSNEAAGGMLDVSSLCRQQGTLGESRGAAAGALGGSEYNSAA